VRPTLSNFLTGLLSSATLIGALAMSGCAPDGGKEDVSLSARASVNAPSLRTTPQRDVRPVIACFGDSLTAGYGAEPGQSYPDFLQALLDRDGYNYHVVNIGMSGATTKDGVSRVAAVTALHPALTVVEFGGNDGLRGLPVDQAQANLNIIVAAVRQSGSQVALAGITIPPQYGGDYVKRFNAIFPAVAHRNHVPFLPFLLQGVYGVEGSMQADGIHATGVGNQQVAHNVENLIQPMLQRASPLP
jgi:acyl-CoA thioesterase I